jgi:hypothetical protein
MTDGNQPPSEPPYGQPPAYGGPPPGQPEQPVNPYAPPAYAPQQYGAPYGYSDAAPQAGDKRPGTVLAGALVAIVLSGLTAVLTGLGLVALVIARQDFLAEVRGTPEFQDTNVSADDLYNVVFGLLVVVLVWALVGCLLGFLAMRRSKVGRVLTVISAAVVALVSLLLIGSGVAALWLIGSVTSIVLLFTGGANDWYARRGPGRGAFG